MIRRLLADANLNAAIVTGLVRKRSTIDFKRAEDVPLKGMADPLVLAAASEEGRVLVSHDVRSIPSHFREFARENVSPGVILVPQSLRIGSAIETLQLVCEVYEPSELSNRICLLPSLVMLGP
jgi:predicted nuclease of predicted toxin-antitoxin system